MGQQLNAREKRNRRKRYIKRIRAKQNEKNSKKK